jgi:intracellular sulfur oxidation DsrE/DsrF family protein
MQKLNDIDDQVLEAFVDGQLDPVQCEMVIKALEDDADVRERVYQLRRAKDLMKIGFGSAKAPERKLSVDRAKSAPRRLPFAVAASLVAALVGLGSGALGYYASQTMAAAHSDAEAALARVAEERVILHVNQSDPALFAKTLSYIDTLLERQKTHNSQIEVIANASGLDLVRKGVSPFEDEVVAMMRAHDNVQFIACANAIQALRSQGVEPVIIDHVPTQQTSIERIVERLQDGWTYVRVDKLPEV